MSKAQLFLIPLLFATGLNAGTLNTVVCYLDGVNGGPPQYEMVTGVFSASCSLDGGGGSSASSTTDNLGDFSVYAFSSEGFRDPTQSTTATGTFMAALTFAPFCKELSNRCGIAGSGGFQERRVKTTHSKLLI